MRIVVLVFVLITVNVRRADLVIHHRTIRDAALDASWNEKLVRFFRISLICGAKTLLTVT